MCFLIFETAFSLNLVYGFKTDINLKLSKMFPYYYTFAVNVSQNSPLLKKLVLGIGKPNTFLLEYLKQQ